MLFIFLRLNDNLGDSFHCNLLYEAKGMLNFRGEGLLACIPRNKNWNIKFKLFFLKISGKANHRFYLNWYNINVTISTHLSSIETRVHYANVPHTQLTIDSGHLLLLKFHQHNSWCIQIKFTKNAISVLLVKNNFIQSELTGNYDIKLSSNDEITSFIDWSCNDKHFLKHT